MDQEVVVGPGDRAGAGDRGEEQGQGVFQLGGGVQGEGGIPFAPDPFSELGRCSLVGAGAAPENWGPGAAAWSSPLESPASRTTWGRPRS